RPEGLEAHEVALEGRLVLGPDALHGEHALAQHAPALLEVGAVILHLLGVPPPPMPKRTRPRERKSRLATSLAVVIGSRSTRRQIPEPTLSVVVTAAAVASATNRSCV